MSEVLMETPETGDPNCEHCKARAEQDTQNHETSMAFLLALMPVLVLTFFGQVGLL